MGEKIKELLERELGKDGVVEDVDEYFPEQPASLPVCAVRPGSYEEAAAVLKICNYSSVKVFTTYERYFDPVLDYSGSVIFEFSRLAAIDRLDARNLIAHVGRGVHFKEVVEAARAEGVDVFMPLVTPTASISECYAMRHPVRECARYGDLNISNMYVALPEGLIHRTGQHALSEEAGDCRDDPGPNLSRWYFGAPDIMGVMVRSSVYLYPRWEVRKGEVWKVRDLKVAGEVLRNVPRHELTVECFTGDAKSLEELTGAGLDKGLTFVVLGYAGREKLVNYNIRRVEKMMLKWGAERVVTIEDEMWTRRSIFSSGSTAVIYGSYPDFRNKVVSAAGAVEDEMGKTPRYVVSSFSRGGAFVLVVWCEGLWSSRIRNICTKLEWAFPGVPPLDASRFYSSTERKFLNQVKRITDPAGILNPCYSV